MQFVLTRWRRRYPKLRFVRCYATFRIICPFCSTAPHKTRTMRFRVPPNTFTQKEKPPYRRFSFWWRRQHPKLRFVRCFATFRIICPFCSTAPHKTRTMRFRAPPNTFTQKEKPPYRRFSFWWRRRYSKPRPKISPRNFLRAYSLYKHSLCQKPNDRRLISVALLCVMSYKAVAHSHLLLLDAPFGIAVLPEGTAALIRQQVKLRFCRLFLNFEAFMVVPRHRSLITTQNPRRNPFVPVFI